MSQQVVGLERTGEGKAESLEPYVYSFNEPLFLDYVYGQPKVIARLKDIVTQLKFHKVYKYWDSNPPKGLLFYGEPGVGKTWAARCFASEADATLVELKYQDIASHFVDKPIEYLNQIKQMVEKLSLEKHVIVFLDEMDAFLPARGLFGADAHDRKRVNFFLTWMSGGLKEGSRLTFIGTTNKPELIDPAATRSGRFSEQFKFVPLTPEDVYACLLNQFERRQKKAGATLLGKLDKKKILPVLQTCSGADTEQILEVALFAKAKRHQANLEPKLTEAINDEISRKLTLNNVMGIILELHQEDTPAPITTGDLIEAILIVQNRNIPQKKGIGF